MAKQLKGTNPWLSIWVKPRATIAAIVDYDPKYRFIILSALYGFPMLLQMAQSLSLGQKFTLPAILIGALVLATLVGMIGITITTALITWTGRWIGGNASFYPVRAAVSWANVPNIVSIIMWLIVVGTFQNETFMEGMGQKALAGNQQMIVLVTSLIQTVASVWALVILVKGIGEVQGFSAWKGLLNVMIPFVLVALFVWIISWIVWLSTGMPA